MKRKKRFAQGFALFVVIFLVYWWPIKSVQLPNPSDPDGVPYSAIAINLPPFLIERQMSLKDMSRDDATKLYVKRTTKSWAYDWRVALNFYGKVEDENSLPVEGAVVRLMWNTVNVPGGTQFDRITSDKDGLFALTGKYGKILGVRVSKVGYYTVDGGAGEMSFEYADPSSPYWYEPNSKSPVIFHLRQKGTGAQLFSKRMDVPLRNGLGEARVNLMQGFIKPDGVFKMESDTTHALPGAQPFPWIFALSMAEGGLIETKEQFPFIAPVNGYTPSIAISNDNLDRSVWQGGVKKSYYFYLPSTNTYGRITIDKTASLPAVSLSIAYNLKPGERVLEPSQ